MLVKNIDITPAMHEYLVRVGGVDTPELATIRELAEKHPQQVMQTTAEQGQLLYFLTKLIKAKNALELGVFLGYGTLATALALPDDGKIIACDITDDNAKQAIPYWEKAGVKDKIELRIMPALDLLGILGQDASLEFDFVFIDADKANYEKYYDLIVPMLSSGGLLLIDNTLWKGQVADDNINDEQTEMFRLLNQKIADDKRVTSCLLPLADGVTMITKV